MCKKLESLCLTKKGRVADDDGYDPEYDSKIGEIFKNNCAIKQIFLRNFSLSGSCFEHIINPSLLTSLKLVRCVGLDAVTLKSFLQEASSLLKFAIIDAPSPDWFNFCVIKGLLSSNCPLMELHLEGCESSFDDDMISELFKLKKKLKKMYLSDYVISYENIREFPNFSELALDNVKFNIPFLTFYRNKLVNLAWLSLFNCKITDQILKLIKLACNLRQLDLSGCTFDISDGDKEGSMTNLEKIYVVDCADVCDSFIAEIVKCKKLSSLSYRACNGVDVVRFFEMIKDILTLKTLDLSGIDTLVLPRVDKMNSESRLLIEVVINNKGLINLDLFDLHYLPEEFLGYLDNAMLFENRTLNVFWEFSSDSLQQIVSNLKLFSVPFNDYTAIEDKCNHFDE